MLPERMNEVELQRIRIRCNMERTSSCLGSGKQQRTETTKQSRKLDSKEAPPYPGDMDTEMVSLVGPKRKEKATSWVRGYQLKF